jgi:hypothetical protein
MDAFGHSAMSEMELLRLTVHLTSLDRILLDSDRLLGVGQSPASVNIPVKLHKHKHHVPLLQKCFRYVIDAHFRAPHSTFVLLSVTYEIGRENHNM